MTTDTRFYAPLGSVTLGQAAQLTGARLVGDENRTISGVSALSNATGRDLAFLESDGRTLPATSLKAGALVINEADRRFVPDDIPMLVAQYPRHAHGQVARALFRPWHMLPPSEQAGLPGPAIHATAGIQPGAIVYNGAAIGEGTIVGSNAVIGPGVQVGRHCIIGAGVTVFCALLGDHVTLLSGARIGETGFGVMTGPSGAEDAPHLGRVILQDHVTIGANSCVDRGVFEDTIVGERTKVDNLCQIAHNVVLGRGVVVAAFGGISGSVRVGDGSMLGGRVGIADHVSVGERVSLAASAGLFRDVDAGETWGGTPAKPIRQWMREVAWLQKQANPKKTG